MILLDTHIWIWWITGSDRLSETQKKIILKNESDEIGVSIISCWEVAKLVEYNRLSLSCPVDEWIQKGLNYPGISLLNLTPDIVVESTRLPGNFHRDPADQLIVATARIQKCQLVTSDKKILNYTDVESIS